MCLINRQTGRSGSKQVVSISQRQALINRHKSTPPGSISNPSRAVEYGKAEC
jgi:hypothetical protein